MTKIHLIKYKLPQLRYVLVGNATVYIPVLSVERPSAEITHPIPLTKSAKQQKKNFGVY